MQEMWILRKKIVLRLMMCLTSGSSALLIFESDDGWYIRTKGNEINAMFLCPKCVKKGSGKSLDNASHAHEKETGMHWSIKLITSISSAASTMLLINGLIVAYKHWLKRKRQHEQARFLKLFEETDDIEYELGLGPLSDSIEKYVLMLLTL